MMMKYRKSMEKYVELLDAFDIFFKILFFFSFSFFVVFSMFGKQTCDRFKTRKAWLNHVLNLHS